MFIDSTGVIGIIMGAGTVVTTGSLFVSLFLVLMFLFALCLVFSIEFEYSAILLLPMLLGYASYYKEFIAPLGVLLIYLAMIFTKKFLFK